MQSTVLRAQLESVLGGRISTPFTDLDKRVCDTVPTGIAALDSRIGGLTRGAVSEIFGPPSSGKTSMLLSILAAATAREETCAIVDGNDAFSPESAASAGIDLQRLLWVRCHTLDQTLKVTDLLLQGGGFGVVAIDLSDHPVNTLHSVPLATWFRFQRSIEKTPTILMIVSETGVAKTCAALALRTRRGYCELKNAIPSHTALLECFVPDVDVVRNRSFNSQFEIRNSQSYVRFHLYSSFSRPGSRP